MTEALAITNIDELSRISKMFASSGMFSDVKDAAQAGVKIMAGQAMGIAPFVAMKNIHIIKGNASVGAGIISAAIRAHPNYNYRVKKLDEITCILEVIVKGEDGYKADVEFTIQQAKNVTVYKKDGSKTTLYDSNPNWRSYPQNMLFARAIANAHRFHCPDIFMGAPVYEESELQAIDVEDVTELHGDVSTTQMALAEGGDEYGDPIDALEVPAEPEDYSDIIAAIGGEMKRVGWTKAKAQAHCKSQYGKASSLDLDGKELRQMLEHLQAIEAKEVTA